LFELVCIHRLSFTLSEGEELENNDDEFTKGNDEVEEDDDEG